MDYSDAIMEILDAAGQVKLPHYRLDVVTIARREFAKRGCCDNKFIAPIESVLRECLRKWSLEQKREIWQTTETGAASGTRFKKNDDASMEMFLEDELMYYIIEELSPRKKRSIRDFDDDSDEF